MENVTVKFWNIVVVVRENNVLLIERNKGDFEGFVPPGGKVELEESFTDSAIRELKEETGLSATKIQQRGISGYINTEKRDRYVFIDFLCTEFTGELTLNGPEGKCSWIPIKDIENIEMMSDIKLRMLELLKGNFYEYQMYWDEKKKGIKFDHLLSEKALDIK